MSFSRVSSVLVGDGTNSAVYGSLTYATIAAGDLAVINRAGAVLTSSSTPSSAAGNDVIQIVQGLSTGTTKKTKPIQGKKITGYSIATYAAATQQVIALGSNGTDGSLVATDNALYKLVIELRTSVNILPNQAAKYVFFYQAGTGLTQNTLAEAFVTKINADRNASVLFTAAELTETTNHGIQITGKAVPADSYGIDRYEFVTFDAYISYTTTTDPTTPVAAASTIRTTTAPVSAIGTYAQVFDMWKDSIFNEGYNNWTQFPVASLPAGGPVSGTTYTLVSIEYFDEHPGDLQNAHKSPCIVVIAVPSGSAQLTALVACLDNYIVTGLGIDKK